MKDSKAANVQLFRAGPDVDEVVGGGVSHVGEGLRTGITKIRIGEESMDFKLKNRTFCDHPVIFSTCLVHFNDIQVYVCFE